MRALQDNGKPSASAAHVKDAQTWISSWMLKQNKAAGSATDAPSAKAVKKAASAPALPSSAAVPSAKQQKGSSPEDFDFNDIPVGKSNNRGKDAPAQPAAPEGPPEVALGKVWKPGPVSSSTSRFACSVLSLETGRFRPPPSQPC